MSQENKQQKREYTGTWIPRAVMEDENLKATHRILYAEIASYDECWQKSEVLMKRCGLGESAFQDAMKLLVSLGYITQKRKFGRMVRRSTPHNSHQSEKQGVHHGGMYRDDGGGFHGVHIDNSKNTTRQQVEGGASNETMVAPSTDAQPTHGAAIEEQATDRHSSSLNRKPSATSDDKELVEQVVDASAKQINGRLTNTEENVISNELWQQLTDMLTPNEQYKPEFNPILSQILASANPELRTQSAESQLLAAVRHRAKDAYIADKPHLKTMSVFLKSEIGGVPVWLSCMTEGNKRKKMF